MKRLALLAVLLSAFAFVPAPSKAATIYVSGTINTTTTWSSNVYVLQGDVTIGSSGRVNVEDGAVMKFNGEYAKLHVYGELNAHGSSATSVYFTSLKDDDAGGDTNGDGGATSPGIDDWDAIQFYSGASSTIEYAVIRYGGKQGSFVKNTGGNLSISESEIAHSGGEGVYITSGTTTIASTQIQDQEDFGVNAQGGAAITLTGNTFTDNDDGSVFINLTSGIAFSHSGNTAAGWRSGFVMSGTLAGDTTWSADDMPYIILSVTIPSGKTLTVEAGAVVKGGETYGDLAVSGILKAQGTAGNKIYFTSFNDDELNDTNATSISPASADWVGIRLASGASSTITHAIVRYGGYTYNANLYNSGGILTLVSSEVSESSKVGIYQGSGTTTISGSELHSQNYGLEMGAGVGNVSASVFHDHTQYGIFGSTGILNVTGSLFYDNTIDVYTGPSVTYTESGNIFNSTGIVKGGTLTANETWTASSVPYVIAFPVVVPSGITLTIEEGVIAKVFTATSSFIVYGTLDAQGASGDPIYLTSIKDDSLGGDTNQDSTTTTPAAGDWETIFIGSGGTATFTHTFIRYGGYLGGSYVSLYNHGGTVALDNVEIATSTNYGIYQSSGSMDILSSDVLHTDSVGIGVGGGTLSVSGTRVRYNAYGVYLLGGTADIGSSVFNDNSVEDVYVLGGSSHTLNENAFYGYGATHYAVDDSTVGSSDVTNNWWGSEGPPGTCTYGDCSATATPNIDHEPWHHLIGVWSVENFELNWHGSSSFTSYLLAANDLWNDTGSGVGVVTVSSVSTTSNARVLIIDDAIQEDYLGLYLPADTPTATDTIYFFTKVMAGESVNEQKHVTIHELGHALGLGHSDPITDTMMASTVNAIVTLQEEDIGDYQFLWNTMGWWSGLDVDGWLRAIW